MNKFLVWLKSIFIPIFVGIVVGLIISSFIDYDTLKQPPLSPPSIVFPIVWTILYILMGVSYAILKLDDQVNNNVNLIYYIQLFINALWPIAFFVFKWRGFAFLWIILLDIAIITMIKIFYDKNKTSAWLQVPYLIWSLFATYLNLGVYLLNK